MMYDLRVMYEVSFVHALLRRKIKTKQRFYLFIFNEKALFIALLLD